MRPYQRRCLRKNILDFNSVAESNSYKHLIFNN